MSGRPKRKAVDATAQRAKRARGETGLSNGLRWTAEGKPLKGACSPLLVLTSDDLEGRSKVAGFDIDFTVIRTASGRKFATGNFVNETGRYPPPPHLVFSCGSYAAITKPRLLYV